MKARRTGVLLVCACALLTLSSQSRADIDVDDDSEATLTAYSLGADVVYADIGFIAGIDYFTVPFNIAHDGQYRTTLTDFGLPAPFDSLQFSVTSLTQSFGTLHQPGSFDFFAEPGQYYASLFGDGGGFYDVGLYGVQIAVVPEAEMWALMLAGIPLLAYRLRRRGVRRHSFQF